MKRSDSIDFEKAYQKFLDGTATAEEVEFIRNKMKKASAVNDILDQVRSEGATKTADLETVKKAVNTFRKKDFIKVLSIVCCVMLLLSIGASCAIGIPLFKNAKATMNYTAAQAEQIAIAFVSEKYPSNAGKIEVHRAEKELDLDGRIKHARYIYVLDMYNGVNNVGN